MPYTKNHGLFAYERIELFFNLYEANENCYPEGPQMRHSLTKMLANPLAAQPKSLSFSEYFGFKMENSITLFFF